MALTHAQAMGGHLRFGYEVTYGKDFKAMRDDNGADYPWLLFGLAGLMEEYDRLTAAGEAGLGRDRVVEGLINGLTPDPTAVLGKPVSWFAPHQAELDRFLRCVRAASGRISMPAIEIASPARPRLLANRALLQLFPERAEGRRRRRAAARQRLRRSV